MSTILSEWRPLVEFLYFISGIILSFGVALTVIQLYLIRYDRISRLEKAESEKAIDFSSRYLNNFVPLHSALKDYEKAHNTSFDWSQKFNKIPTEKQVAMMKSMINDIDYMKLINRCLNELEAISSAFVHGIADKDVGFGIIGRSYVNTISSYTALLAIFGSDDKNRHYSSIIDLHEEWNAKIREGDIKSNIEKLQNKLQNMSGKNTSTPK